MDTLLKLLTRWVEAQEKIAEALGEMQAEGLTIRGASVAGAGPAGEEEKGEESLGIDDAEEEKADEEDEKKPPTFEELRKSIRAYAADKGEPAALKLLKKFKAARISELKEKDYQAVADELEKLGA